MRPRFDPWVGKIPCRREGLATLVFLPGEFHAQKNLAGYTPWGHKDSDMTEQLTPSLWGFPGGANGNKSACQCRRCKRCRFHPWVGRLPWSRKWQPTSVFLPGEFYGPRSLQPWDLEEKDTIEPLTLTYSLLQYADAIIDFSDLDIIWFIFFLLRKRN